MRHEHLRNARCVQCSARPDQPGQEDRVKNRHIGAVTFQRGAQCLAVEQQMTLRDMHNLDAARGGGG